MDYQSCTVGELALHVNNTTSQAITQQLSYYRKRGNTEIVSKIKTARLLAKQVKISEKLRGLV